MSKKVCFDKNTFVIGIIIVIFILSLLSYFINFKYNNNNKARLQNLINKKILNIKDKIINILANIFEWGTAIGSILTIVVSALGGSFIGVMTGAIALTISILASAYIYNKINK